MYFVFHAFLALSHPAKIDVPAAYYTLAELTSEIQRQGTDVHVDPSCKDDLYAVQALNTDWPSLKNALEADERLVITPSKAGWDIKRSPENKAEESRALTKYLFSAVDTIRDTYGPATLYCRAMQKMPEADRDKSGLAFASGASNSPAEAGARQLAYLWYETEVQFATLAVPAAMTENRTTDVFGRAIVSNCFDSRFLVTPDGNFRTVKWPLLELDKMNDAELEKTLRALSLTSKLRIDPLSLTTSCTVVAPLTPDHPISFPLNQGQYWNLHPTPKLTPQSLWPQGVASKFQSRSAQSFESLPAVETEMPKRILRASEALLFCAKATGSNLVSHVTSFTDTTLPVAKRASIRSIVEAVNAGNVDPRWLAQGIEERIAPPATEQAKRALNLEKPWTATSKDGFVVVRDEFGFLDALSSSPPALSTAADNEKLNGKMPQLEEILRAVSKLNITTWHTSIFSSNYLAWCNPLSFRPIALTMERSNTLWKGVKQAYAEGVSKVVTTDLEPEAREALQRGLDESSLLCDANFGIAPPTCAGNLFKAGKSTTITITSHRGRVTFSLKNEFGEFWRTWVQGADLLPPQVDSLYRQ